MAEIRCVRHGATALVTLDAPHRRNALTRDMAVELLGTLREIADDPQVAVTVLCGSEGNFCAGGDRGLLAGAGTDPVAEEAYTGLGLVYEVFAAVDQLPTVTIAALQGWSVGAGLNLALAADLRVIGEGATLRSGFAQLGIHPGGGHFTLINRLANRETAVAMALLGQDVRGAEAVRRDLAWECVPDDEVVQRALDLAGSLSDARLARTAVANLRQEAGTGDLDLRAATQLERAAQMWSLRQVATR